MQQTEGWTDGQKKWHIEVGALKKKKEDNCKQNSLIQTLVYRSNIYYSKVYQRENWKKKKKKKAQISIWKCGLGILDIDTQWNSLELQWI